MVARIASFAVVAMLLLAAAAAGFIPAGQAAEAAPAQDYAPLIEQAKKDGATVIIIAPGAKTGEAVAAPAAEGVTDMGLRLRAEAQRLIMHSPDIPRRAGIALEIISGDGSLKWLGIAIATAIAGILIGFLPARLIGYWGREHFRYLFNPEPRDDAERIGYLLFRAVMFSLNTALMFAVAILVAILFDTGHEPTRKTIFVIVSAYCIWRVLRMVVAMNLLAPDIPSHRMLNISNDDAKAAYNDVKWVFAVAITVLALSAWITSLDLDADANKLLLMIASLIAAGLIGYLTVKYRKTFAGVILGAGSPEEKPLRLRVLAGSWHILALLYLAAATAFSLVRLMLNLPSANMLISAPGVAFFSAIAMYGVLYLLIESFFRGRRAAYDRKLRVQLKLARTHKSDEEAARGEIEKAGLLPGEEVVENRVEPQPDHAALPQYRPIFQPLARRAAALIVTFVSLGFIAEAWDISASDGRNIVSGFMNTLGVAFVAWVLYRAVALYTDAKLAEETVDAPGGAAGDGDEIAVHGTTRLGTLLPLLRNVLSAVIVGIAGMIVMSGLGVDVAPLFAGAGVVGLAVGFGAQTLIRDIFSGGFFLFDDAFRMGEYVEMGDMRGTVEKISLRSFQLRHHNGPLHTVPFGEIKQLTNHSRDWVIMKLPLRLTFDTDLEKVRKLLKKLGQDLLENPEIGKNFLQPLKSQGVVEIDDSAMIVRVKFMTKPDDQWTTRKVVYASIQELFQREGIRFASRQVTVRIAGDDGEAEPSGRRRLAAAAAAEHAIAGLAPPSVQGRTDD